MTIRFSIDSDFGLLIEGLEQTRIIEKRDLKDIKAKPSDIKEYRSAIANKQVRVIEINKKPVAFLYFRTDLELLHIYDPFFWVNLIYVKKKYRNKGLGKKLYDDAVKIAESKGYKKIFIDVFYVNKNSLQFHEKLDFKTVYSIYEKSI